MRRISITLHGTHLLTGFSAFVTSRSANSFGQSQSHVWCRTRGVGLAVLFVIGLITRLPLLIICLRPTLRPLFCTQFRHLSPFVTNESQLHVWEAAANECKWFCSKSKERTGWTVRIRGWSSSKAGIESCSCKATSIQTQRSERRDDGTTEEVTEEEQ